jgi:hypothetical protein
MSQQSYLITKQKLDENEITSKRKNKIQSSITSKSNTEGEIKKNQFFFKKYLIRVITLNSQLGHEIRITP